MKIKFIFPLIILTVLSSCEKEDGADDPMEDREAPTISFISPDENTTYSSGMIMPIKFEVTDNDELHEVHLTVTNLTTGDELFHSHTHQHGQSVTVDTSIMIPSGIMHTDIEVEAEATDHHGNQSVKTVTKHIHM